jgi:nucleoside-diphosphate-sugar epimerase
VSLSLKGANAMHILITGNGMIGRKLADSLVKAGELGGRIRFHIEDEPGVKSW